MQERWKKTKGRNKSEFSGRHSINTNLEEKVDSKISIIVEFNVM